jgi:hypothetical protein
MKSLNLFPKQHKTMKNLEILLLENQFLISKHNFLEYIILFQQIFKQILFQPTICQF